MPTWSTAAFLGTQVSALAAVTAAVTTVAAAVLGNPNVEGNGLEAPLLGRYALGRELHRLENALGAEGALLLELARGDLLVGLSLGQEAHMNAGDVLLRIPLALKQLLRGDAALLALNLRSEGVPRPSSLMGLPSASRCTMQETAFNFNW